MLKPHISFSELKDWNFCPHYHNQVHFQKVKGFRGNAFTAFGNAIHDTCEKTLTEDLKDPYGFFADRFVNVLNELKADGIEIDESLVEKMETQAAPLIENVLPALKDYFGQYEVHAAEESLYENIDDAPQKYKGFIDLVLKTPDGKYHIIDWKTCSWGWDMRRRSDPMTTYQLTFYKYFWAKKHNVALENIETHFALMKRTAKKDHIEIFRVTSGNKKMSNALKFMHKALYNINRKMKIKNRLSCKNCDLYKTEHCK